MVIIWDLNDKHSETMFLHFPYKSNNRAEKEQGKIDNNLNINKHCELEVKLIKSKPVSYIPQTVKSKIKHCLNFFKKRDPTEMYEIEMK